MGSSGMIDGASQRSRRPISEVYLAAANSTATRRRQHRLFSGPFVCLLLVSSPEPDSRVELSAGLEIYARVKQHTSYTSMPS